MAEICEQILHTTIVLLDLIQLSCVNHVDLIRK